MVKKNKILVLLILFSLVLPFIAPLGEIAYATRPEFDDAQIFYLPIVDGENDSTIDSVFALQSDRRSSYVGEYNFKGDLVKVYIESEQRYPILGRVPIIIKLVAQNTDTLEDIDYTITLSDGVEKHISSDIVEKYEYDYEDGKSIRSKYILVYFPETITPGDYSISLEAKDSLGALENIIQIEKDNIIEKTEATEVPEEIQEIIEEDLQVEPESEIIEMGELIKENNDLSMIEGLEEILESSEEEPIENIKEPIKNQVEENNIEVEAIIEGTDSSFNTDSVSITLLWEDIIDNNEIIIDKHDPSLYIRNLGKGGKLEVKVLDSRGDIVYTTNDRIGNERYLYKNNYYKKPFYNLDYDLYSGSIQLFKADEITKGIHNLVLTLDGREIYKDEINLVDKYPVVNSVEIDKYLLAGDREFKLNVSGEYITKKDLLKLEVVDNRDNIIASSIESHYTNVNNEGDYVKILYTMKVESNEQIMDYEEYKVKLTYLGSEDLVVRTSHTNISTTTGIQVYGANLTQANEGKIILDGINFSNDDFYIAEVRYEGEEAVQYTADYINSRELSVDIDSRINRGNYNITLYNKRTDENHGYNDYIGYIYFYFYDDAVEPTGSPELGYVDVEKVSFDQQSYNGEIYIMNFVPENLEDIEILLVDIDEKVVGQAEIDGYSYSTRYSWIRFKMNILEPLNEGEYYYIYKYRGTEIKGSNNGRLSVFVINKAYIRDIEIKGALYDEIIPFNTEIDFTLRNGLNLKDISKLDVFIENTEGQRIAYLVPDTLTIVEEYSTTNYMGKLNLLDEGKVEIVVAYDGQVIYRRGIEISSKPYIDKLRIDRNISSYSKESQITLYRTLNIDSQEVKVEVYDLKGNKVDTSTELIGQWEENKFPGVKNTDISIKFNERLKDAYYELYVYYGDIDLTENSSSYHMGFYATKGSVLTGTSSGLKYENDNMIMQLTNFTEATNTNPGESYKGYFYLKGATHDEQELIGTVDLVSGEKHGKTGILIPSELFIDYPLGTYDLIILNSDGELFGRSYFNISYRDYKNPDSDNPGLRRPSFTVNNGLNYTNKKAVNLSINPDGYTLIKIANNEAELINAEALNIQNMMGWDLPDGDGEKTIYVQFSDEKGNQSEILSKTIILDTVVPVLSEVTVSKVDKVNIGDILDITALGNERVNAKGVLYLNGVEVDKFSLEYSGKADLHKYTKSLRVNKEIDKIVVYLEDFAGNKSLAKETNINIFKVETKNLTVLVKDTAGNPQVNKNISVYNYRENVYRQGYTDSEGKIVFSLPNNLSYEVRLYSDGYWDYKDVSLTQDMEITFETPVIRVITGRATVGTNPVSNASIILTGNGQQFYGNTNEDGYYRIEVYENTSGTNSKEFELTANHPLYTTIAEKISSDIIEKNIVFYNKVNVYGTVKDNSGNPIPNLQIYANGWSDWKTTYTDSNGNYELRLNAGEYNIGHGWVQNHESQNKNIVIGEQELKEGAIKTDFILNAINYNNSFNGEGNNIKADATITQIGKNFNLTVNYKNNGSSNATGTVKVDLPTGIEVVAGNLNSIFTNLEPQQSGKMTLSLKVTDNFKDKKIVIPAKITIGGTEYSIGFAELDLIDVTINAPGLVADGNFKVYGEATEGSTVSIIDRNTNNLMAVGKVTGKWYNADIVDLPEGEYQLFARAEKNGNIANSTTVDVKVDPINGVQVKDIKVITPGGNEVGMNHEIGVPAFSAWVDMSLRGKDIAIDVELNKYLDGMKAEFLFADKQYEATYSNGRWKANLTGWSGSGVKQIKMRITIGDLEYEFVVGEVIILIDPSGYVYDINTGDRIEGATATLEKWNGSSWEFWDAELYGQINPQKTDDEGKYGWMVGEGIYRVIIEKAGYETAIAGNDKDIVIPPPRDDVNIGLKSTMEEYIGMEQKQAPTEDHSWTIEFNKEVDSNSVNLNNVYIMDENGNKLAFINPRVDGNNIILDNKGTFTKGKTYTIVIRNTVKSIDGKSLTQGINMKFTVK
ncbi:carboxypeptidase regulatory-like domain-containing protein [Tissierella pigra]|uniref:SbsA Ig-like domain-containing protein n=1 Tax=Tissierella pigra TaxID=2607614 RepID=A0A6N7XUU8_9FIRM|nr:Ig-like domain-containing protein [Tissierella pigra]MSU00255.1 hypothetical protein [Tissierella pigra]